MHDDDPTAVAEAFNRCINERDLSALVALMSEDHAFIDAGNQRVDGIAPVRESWAQFFDIWPDYRNAFTQVLLREDLVVMVGTSTCSEPSLEGPAIWTARVRGTLVTEWRVWADTPSNRDSLGVAG